MLKVNIILVGNAPDAHREFWQQLAEATHAEEVAKVEDCDVTLTFCPIVSRVGTDIEAASKQIPASRPGVLVALHPTFNQDEVVPDVSHYVPRSDILSVSCLFFEDKLLTCFNNERALQKVFEYLQQFHRKIPAQTSRSNRSHSNQPHQLHPGDIESRPNEHRDCLDLTQHPKYMLMVLGAFAIVFIVIAFIVILTSISAH